MDILSRRNEYKYRIVTPHIFTPLQTIKPVSQHPHPLPSSHTNLSKSTNFTSSFGAQCQTSSKLFRASHSPPSNPGHTRNTTRLGGGHASVLLDRRRDRPYGPRCLYFEFSISVQPSGTAYFTAVTLGIPVVSRNGKEVWKSLSTTSSIKSMSRSSNTQLEVIHSSFPPYTTDANRKPNHAIPNTRSNFPSASARATFTPDRGP